MTKIQSGSFRLWFVLMGLTAVLSAHGQTITTYAGGAFPADNTNPYSVSHPTAIARDASGNLYVAAGDPTNSQIGSNASVVRGNRIFKIDPSGNVSLIAGNGQFPTGVANNVQATQAAIDLPAGIAVDPNRHTSRRAPFWLILRSSSAMKTAR